MCNVAAFFLAASAATQFMSQQQQAQAERSFQKQLVEESDKSAKRSFQNDVNQTGKRIEEERETAAQKLQEKRIEAAQARATAQVITGEAGVTGASVTARLLDLERQEALGAEAIKRNLEFTETQLTANLEGLRVQAQNRVHIPQPVLQPNPFTSIIRIGADIAGTF